MTIVGEIKIVNQNYFDVANVPVDKSERLEYVGGEQNRNGALAGAPL